MSTSIRANSKKWCVLLFFGITLTLTCSAHAVQVLYGSLTGTVTDATDAIVPSATVEVLNVGTGIMKKTISNETGVYLFSDLQPGVYKVTVSLQGFATVVQEGLRIEGNRVQRFDARLVAAGRTEVVSVTAADAAIALQTDRVDVNFAQSPTQVSNLPLAGTTGRNYQSLMVLVPGALL